MDITLIIKTLMTGAVVVALRGAAGAFGFKQPCGVLWFKRKMKITRVRTVGRGSVRAL